MYARFRPKQWPRNNQRNYSDISFWLELILEENDMEKHLPHGKRQIQEVLGEERSRKNV